MTPATCECGFTELPDEQFLDHLLHAFEPPDGKGTDGLLHEEGDHRTCSCGHAASTTADLDQHFLAAFTPPGAVGRDGSRHKAIN